MEWRPLGWSGGPGAPPPAELPVEDASSSSLDTSTDNSSSASDESADGQDLCGVVADDSAPDELGWLRQVRSCTSSVKKLKPSRVVVQRLHIPARPAECGRGFTLTPRTDFCQRCLGRVPRGLHLALAEHCQWLH